uniref:Placenta associated 9 n=1 Tax=Crocodylus porosus TaxID=8502 RepID=A0A7M4ESV4_CROPO
FQPLVCGRLGVCRLSTADPVSVSPGSSQGTEWCKDHNTIHRRLDVIEEQVEKTVDYLDSEVKALLNTISETAWNVPVPPGTPVKDIFDGIDLTEM